MVKWDATGLEHTYLGMEPTALYRECVLLLEHTYLGMEATAL